MSQVFKGSCCCGEIRFEVVSPTKWAAHCHCEDCRRAHGAAYVSWVGVALQQFKFCSEQGSLRWYASSESAKRGFCVKCGSTMFYRGDRWQDEIHIARAYFIDFIDRDPSAHVYFDRKPSWSSVDSSLPCLGGDDGTSKLES